MAKKKRGAQEGNSNASKGNNKLDRFHVWFGIDEWFRWKQIAKDQGLTRSEWIRRELRAAAKRWERKNK